MKMPLRLLPVSRVLRRLGQSRRADLVVLAVLAYVPLLLTAPGVVGADTKPYLYLDPGRLLAGAPYMWLEDVGLGTVPHQNIGYLWPMGPFFWLFDAVGSPDWLAQRLWLATLLFVAGSGVRYLLRAIGWENGGILIASAAYMLSPYSLAYVARISVLLLPWAGLGWLIGLAAQALRVGGWRYPAGFALVAMTIGGTNATSLLLIGIGPVLWLVHAWLVDKHVDFISVAATAARIGSLTTATAVWWIAGLRMQGRYGPPVLEYTETYETIANASTATEVFRGLGYWFFYGNDSLGQWIEPSIAYTSRSWLLILSFCLPILALVAAGLTHWRHRSFFVLLIVVGGLVAVGGHPYEDGSILGDWFTAFTGTESGLALRSTPRATPLLVLGTSVFLGAGVAALARWRPVVEGPLRVGILLLIVANLPPLWTGQFIAEHLQRPEQIPSYWQEAAAALDAGDHMTRILEVPGSDFASYRWGNTVEPITPGLTARPYVARELIPFGSESAASLLIELDRGLQEGTFSPASLAPIARLMGVGDVVLRADLKYERFRTPRPNETYGDLLGAPGLGAPMSYGPRLDNVAGPEQTLIDEIELGSDAEEPVAAPVEIFPLDAPLPIIRARPGTAPVIVAGDASGLVDAAAAGLLDTDRLIVFSATFADDPSALEALVGPVDDSATLIVTDTNRRQARHWGTIRENTGYVERADELPADDPADYRLNVFPDAGADAQTVAVHDGATVSASAYGNPVTYTADNRASLAADGDRATAWRVGAFDDVRGESLTMTFDSTVQASAITVLQPVTGNRNRHITKLRVFADDQAIDVDLTARSRRGRGQTIDLRGINEFARLELQVLETNSGPRDNYVGLSGVGIAEVSVPGVTFTETLRTPIDLLAAVSNVDQRPLSIVLTRMRSDAREPVRSDSEELMRRELALPTEVETRLTGEVRLNSYTSDARLDGVLLESLASGESLRTASKPIVRASSSTSLAGHLPAKARSAFDADRSTIFTTAFGPQAGGWIEFAVDEPVTLDSLDLDLVIDDRHSVPRTLDLLVDNQLHQQIDLPRFTSTADRDQSTPLSIAIDEVRGTTFRLVFSDVEERITKEWYSRSQVALPIGIAEWRVEALSPTTNLGTLFDSGCRDDLLFVNDVPVPVRISGTVADALQREPLLLESCTASPLVLPAGSSLIRTARGRTTGFDLDRLVLRSDVRPPTLRPPPDITIVDADRVRTTIAVSETSEPFWLVLGQSHNDGWQAISPQVGDLGASQLVDGYANGWYVDPADVDGPLTIELEWTPQRRVWLALIATALFAMLCLVLVVTGRRSSTAPRGDDPRPPPPSSPSPSTTAGGQRPISAKLLAASLAVGAMAFVNLPEYRILAAVVPLALVLALRSATSRPLLPLAAAACLAVSGAFTTISQYRSRFRTDFGWPTAFDEVHVVSVLGLLLLGAELARSHLDNRDGESV